MLKQRIVWTVLPNGIDKNGDLKFSVFVSPRLGTTDAVSELQLDQFPDFLNWTGKVTTIDFGVKLDKAPAVIPVTLDDTQIDKGLWGALFKDTTFVRPHEFKDLQGSIMRTFPVKSLLSYVKKKYVTLGEKSPASLPLLQPRRDDDGKLLDDQAATLETLIDEMGDVLQPEKDIISEVSGDDYDRFMEAVQSGAVTMVLTYIDTCLRTRKFKLSEKAKISKIDPYNMKISDGENEYFMEDTGSAFVMYRYLDLYHKLDEELQKTKVLDPQKLYGLKKEKLDFLQAGRFYDRKEMEQPYYFKPNAKMIKPMPQQPEIDFHQMLATLGDHPLLMRKLGLVLDFTMPRPAVPFSYIHLVPQWQAGNPPAAANVDSSPRTYCILTNTRLSAKPKTGSHIKEGMLDLANVDDDHDGVSDYNLVQYDPDGAALKMLNSTDSIRRQLKKKYLFQVPIQAFLGKACDITLLDMKRYALEYAPKGYQLSRYAKISKPAAGKWTLTDRNDVFEIERTASMLKVSRKLKAPYDAPDDAGLPSFRSAGIALTKAARAFNLNAHLVVMAGKNKDLEDDKPVFLYADDLVRGYRVDIMDHSQSTPLWRSLCRRTGKYTFPDENPKIEVDVGTGDRDDEGYVKGASTSAGHQKDSGLYLHETLFRWNGWSLCAKRPGKTIVSSTSEEEVFLFNWNDVTADNTQLIKFLEDFLDIRWAKDAVIQKSGTDIITVTGTSNSLTLTVETDNTVTLKTEDGTTCLYKLKEEGGDRNVYTYFLRQDEDPGLTTNKAVTEFKLETSFSAKPGSLPSLRFGHVYSMRTRIADIAGNGEPYDSTDSSMASKRIKYTRYEPLIPPAVVPRARFTEGEAVEHMVIRSNFDCTAGDYVESEHVKKALVGLEHTYEEDNQRHIVPPKTSLEMAETHGKFDEYFGQGKHYQEGYNIALKEEGTLAQDKIVNTKTGEKESIPDPDAVEIIIPPHPEKVSEDEVPGKYIIHKEEELLLPYLPDPIGRGAAFRSLPGVISSGTPDLDKIIDPGLDLNVIKVPYYAGPPETPEWYDALPFRIKIVERPGSIAGNSCDETFDNTYDPPEWKDCVLTVFLAKAQVARVRYSCYLDKDDLELMGIWKWLKTSPEKVKLERYALSGSHWMLTPYRELVLVHAVQQPLCEPTIPVLAAIKNKIGDTFATIEGDFHLSVKSTGKVDLLANWTEPVDDLEQDAPGKINVNAHAFELKIDTSFQDTITLPLKPCGKHPHEFGDTRYRLVNYYLKGTTRFREYFHPRVIDYWFCWDDISQSDTDPLVDFLENALKQGWVKTAEITVSNETITVEDENHSLTLTLGRVKVTVTLKNDTEEEYEYNAPEENGKRYIYAGSTDKISRTGPVHTVDVFNSARPAAPKVLYIVPTYGWEEPNLGEDRWDKFERKRVGGGLRVYMDRPWYSSGDGELLGVVLCYHAVEDKLKPYVTQWGMDPLRSSNMPKGVLTVGDFSNVEESGYGLSLEELKDQGGPTLNVAGFKPEYNTERKLWYCDILFRPEIVTSYYPFVRLALTRFQPKSITDAHLSRVVLTDFVQVANDRTLNIEFSNDRQFFISVSGYGTGDRNSNHVYVSIEAADSESPEKFGWVPIDGTKAQPNPYKLALAPLDARTYHWKWHGELELPLSRNKNRYRVVVMEYELLRADTEEVTKKPSPDREHELTREAKRLVYFDVVEIPPS
jgi:hypothetical protein